MPTAACGVSCDVCGLYAKGICSTCVAGTDQRAGKKLDIQMQTIKMQCPILTCAVERKVGCCLKDCVEFPILYRTWDPYEVADYFTSDPDYCLVAEADDRVVGFIMATTIEKEGTAWKKYGYVSWIGVDEDFQGTTLARRLYKGWRSD